MPRASRYEVSGRLDGSGSEVEPFDGDVPEIDDVDAVAVCLLHADLDASHERAVADALVARGLDVVCSHEVSPEFREYERMVTTVVDAALRPVCRAYLLGLASLANEVLVMTSAGGLVPLEDAARRPASLLLSGPVAGVRGGGGRCGGVRLSRCGVVRHGRHQHRRVPRPRRSAGVRADARHRRVPDPAPRRRGAHDRRGGGSIARLDNGGALVVGPESAGARPGPACYGRGGEHATVTDADVVLGRIPADTAFPGLGRIDAAAGRRALERAGVTADGVVAVVDASMERAVRVVTVEQGIDPRDLALVAFGGAGPLHACGVADALGLRAVIVPPRAGVFSAVGLVSSPRRRELVKTWATPASEEGLDRALDALARDASAAVGGAEILETFVDCRYVGQSHELTVPPSG